jgi:uncharacterized protein (PEP-CTERM system associated)
MGGRAERHIIAALALLTLMPKSAAAIWRTAADITLRETYTDNPALLAQPTHGDYITQITPGIRIAGAGARVRADFDYRPSAILYARNTGDDRIANELHAFGSVEAMEKFFFAEAFASVTQGFISPLAPQPDDITTISPNRLETRTYGISPYVSSRFGDAFTYELRRRDKWTTTSNNQVADIHSRAWTGQAASPIRRFGWTLEYDDTNISYTTLPRPDYRAKLYRGRLLFQPDADVRLSASAGREKNNYFLQQERSYYIRGLGVRWSPNLRTRAQVEYERRFFGPYRLARFDHRTRLTAWTLAYSRDASHYQEELLRLSPGNSAALLDAIFAARIPNAVERQAAVEQFLRVTHTPAFLFNSLAFYTQQIFLQESLEASVGILGRRNSIIFSGFRGKSTSLLSAVGTVLPDAFTPGSQITTRGVSVNATHQITPFTTLGAAARRIFSRQENPSSSNARNDFFAATLNHSVSPKTIAFAGLSHTRFDSAPGPSAFRNARAAFLGLSHRF